MSSSGFLLSLLALGAVEGFSFFVLNCLGSGEMARLQVKRNGLVTLRWLGSRLACLAILEPRSIGLVGLPEKTRVLEHEMMTGRFLERSCCRLALMVGDYSCSD